MLTREQIETFKDIEPTRVIRNGQAYSETSEFITSEVTRHVAAYRKLTKSTQLGRLTRDKIDESIRRYHDYVIAGKYKAHYRQVGVLSKKKNVFEHVIPLRTVRNMLIAGVITIEQALNSPTCLITPEKNEILGKLKLTKSTPNAWCFWQRYQALDLQIETWDSVAVDQSTWNLDSHYNYFIKG
jgi:hypothetical protein